MVKVGWILAGVIVSIISLVLLWSVGFSYKNPWGVVAIIGIVIGGLIALGNYVYQVLVLCKNPFRSEG